MKVSPVSFKSLMVFTLDDGNPKLTIPEFMKIAFSKNERLKSYNLVSDIYVHDEPVDGTVHNASLNFAAKMDGKHRKKLYGNTAKNVILSKAKFFVNYKDSRDTYFLTAANATEEDRILKELQNSSDFYTAKF